MALTTVYALTLYCMHYFSERHQIRCYRTVELCNRGFYKQHHLYTPVFDSSVFDGFIGKVARELIWNMSRDARIGFVIAASWLGEQSPRKAVGLLGSGPQVVRRCSGTIAPMKRQVAQRGQWKRSNDFASFLLLLLTCHVLPDKHNSALSCLANNF